MRLSESARVTTAREASFRVQYANSSPRAITVIALDGNAGRVVAELAQKSWNKAVFLDSLRFPAPSNAPDAGSSQDKLDAWLGAVAGHADDLVAEIERADIIVVVASPDTDAHAASIIGAACRQRHKSMIALILSGAGVSDEALSRTLLGMRPLATMLVVANGPEYVEEMLTAMRA